MVSAVYVGHHGGSGRNAGVGRVGALNARFVKELTFRRGALDGERRKKKKTREEERQRKRERESPRKKEKMREREREKGRDN